MDNGYRQRNCVIACLPVQYHAALLSGQRRFHSADYQAPLRAEPEQPARGNRGSTVAAAAGYFHARHDTV